MRNRVYPSLKTLIKLHFAWSSISEILRIEGFFIDEGNDVNQTDTKFVEQNQKISSIIALAFMAIGGVMMINGIIRDFTSFGFSRAFILLLLMVTYIVLAVSSLNKFDLLQYAWVIQTSAGKEVKAVKSLINRLFLSYLSLIFTITYRR